MIFDDNQWYLLFFEFIGYKDKLQNILIEIAMIEQKIDTRRMYHTSLSNFYRVKKSLCSIVCCRHFVKTRDNSIRIFYPYFVSRFEEKYVKI